MQRSKVASRIWEEPETRERDRADRAIATDHRITGSSEGLRPQQAVKAQAFQ